MRLGALGAARTGSFGDGGGCYAHRPTEESSVVDKAIGDRFEKRSRRRGGEGEGVRARG